MEILLTVFSLLPCTKFGKTLILRGYLLNLMQFVIQVKNTVNLKTHFGYSKRRQEPEMLM